MTIKQLKDAIKDLPDGALVCYHGHDKGCCLSGYSLEDTWVFPKDGSPAKAFVMNPGEDYDGRKPNTSTLTQRTASYNKTKI